MAVFIINTENIYFFHTSFIVFSETNCRPNKKSAER